MLQERGVYKKLGVDRATVSNWKRYLSSGKTVSLDKMEDMLIKYGAIPVKEKIWKLLSND
jgi:hypothetical protein